MFPSLQDDTKSIKICKLIFNKSDVKPDFDYIKDLYILPNYKTSVRIKKKCDNVDSKNTGLKMLKNIFRIAQGVC